MPKTTIELQNVQKAYKGNLVLRGVSGKIEEGKTLAIIGPSGSGKSTLLKAINQLEKPTSGSVLFDGQDLVKASNKELQHLGESIGMVFQSFNLFENQTVLKNVTLGLIRVKKMGEKEAEELAHTYLQKVGMDAKAKAYPSALSGGQKQRVAIARALAMKPKVLLFDEPTSALDPENVGEVLKVISELAEEHMSMVVVTHEMNFAKKIADKVWFMQDGQLIEENDPNAIFEQPKEAETKHFIEQVIID
ncbi:amino acid ABC transporter ATP-binding protein [Fructobacillus sp. W13]|uniref:Amino acid ABC transporter ATP-binding protein n=1 Tax=Fructobacillus apis TaxID=2935017 RepID=A0ABT0ZQT8_9LACO|nr:amino acid ABC transporter ATP-binding protein [Fructobacillus apis]MCO0832320.1 amino acid ABC transporter ATP-binding protein [Fructobacillus apis]